MSIIEDSVRLLEDRLQGSGCEDGVVNLHVDPDIKKCQYEHGVCMVATFGGKSAEFVTNDPTRATTKISFMFGVLFQNSRTRSAACAIINAVTGFLCINRVLHACSPDHHKSCLNELKSKINGRKVYLLGYYPVSKMEFLVSSVVENIESADVILVNGDGLASDEGVPSITHLGSDKDMFFIGPSSSGVAILESRPHWCPYGKG
jgi:hypothetical protein